MTGAGWLAPQTERRNSRSFAGVFLLIYLCAPVIYVGVVQAALLDKLGTSGTIANLPMSTFQFAQAAPLLLAWFIPHRREKAAAVVSTLVTAVLTALVALALFLPCPAWVRVWSVIAHGLSQGLTGSIGLVFMIQCLKRGTTPVGQARALQFTYSAGPILAVVGSLAAQYVLNARLAWLPFPYDFALMYALTTPAMLFAAYLASRFEFPPIPEEPRQSVVNYLVTAVREFGTNRALVLLFIAFLLWNCTLGGMSNLSLFTREAVGREPKDLAGWMMAIRFGCKAVGGYVLGMLAVRFGLRAAVLGVLGLNCAGMIWPWIVPGYPFLFAFGLLGAGELGGGFMPNYGSTLVPASIGARTLAVLNMAAPLSSFAPALHGYLAETYGFSWSFGFGLATTAIALWLILKIGKPPSAQPGEAAPSSAVPEAG